MKAWKRIVCAFFGLMTVYVSVSAEVLNGELIGVKKSVFQQSVREDFLTFEKRFVSDAEFQMSRIVFDNLGYKPDDDPESEGVKYSPDNWTVFKNTLDDVRKLGQFKTKRELTADKCVQRIWMEDSGFLLEHTYTRINGKWFLTRVIERY